MRFGVAGLGAIGAIRAASLVRHRDCQLAGVFDLDPARTAPYSSAARVFSSFDEMLRSDEIDAIVVSTPPDTHETMAVETLQSGKHVLIEKPLAPTIEACARILRASQATGKIVTTGYNHRYFEATKIVKDAVDAGTIGNLSHVRGFTGHAGLEEFKSRWMYDAAIMGGGALMDNGTHMIDLVHHIMGGADEVFGVAKGSIWNLPQVEDYAIAAMRSDRGIVGTVEASWDEWKGYRFHVDAYGDRGMARLYYAPMSATLITFDSLGSARKSKTFRFLSNIVREKVRGWQSTVVRTFDEEFSDFAALAGGQARQTRIATIQDGYRAIEIAHATYASSDTGTSVRLQPLTSI